MWFPRPGSPADTLVVVPREGNLDPRLFALLVDPQAEEWTDKVGVAAAVDGSGKTTTRLLHNDGWVFKTDVSQRRGGPDAVRPALEWLGRTAAATGLWHPDKIWFLMFAESGWWPVSACPRLTTIRMRNGWAEQSGLWTRMFRMGLQVWQEHGFGLDLNPSNFGFDDTASGCLYYLDDECYPHHGLRETGEAAAARIPEEHAVEPDQWEAWGARFQRVLSDFCVGLDDYMQILDGMRDYPLVERLQRHRQALIRGVCTGHPLLDSAERRRRRTIRGAGTPAPARRAASLTCVLADVHANLPALEAVLAAAKDFGVDDYLFLGDVVGYGPYPRECIERLAELDRLTAIRGNHDHAVGTGVPEDGINRVARTCVEWTRRVVTSSDREWLCALPVEHRAPRWLAVHGAPQDPNRFYGYVYELTYRDNLAHLRSQGIPVCFYGHTHVAFIHRMLPNARCEKIAPSPLTLTQENHVMLINPGSVGMPRDGDPRAGFALCDWERDLITFHRVSYPVHETVRAVAEADLPPELAYRFEEGR